MKKRILGIIILGLLYMPALWGSTDQVLLEQSLTQIGQQSLDAMFGEGNFILRVRAAMTEPKYEVRYTKQSNPKLSKKSQKGKEVYVLPGIPALKNLAPDSLRTLPFDSITTLTRPKIKRILALVIVNKDFPRKDARKADALLRDVLGLKDDRDQVKMMYKPFFHKPGTAAQRMVLVPGEEKVMSIQNLFFLLILVLLVIFLVIYSLFQIKAGKEKGEGEGGGVSVNVNPNLELPEGLGGGGEGGKINVGAAPQIKHYFDFVQSTNIDNFIFLLKKEKVKPDQIAAILSFLSPQLSGRVMAELTTEEKSQVAIYLVDQRLANRETMNRLEETLKGALECFVGGDATFQGVFDQISEKSKKDVLGLLEKKDPVAYNKVRKQVVIFDDLKNLEDNELAMILSDANIELVSTTLVGADQDVYDKIYGNLTESAKEMASQYLELKSESAQTDEIEKAQDYLLKLSKRLQESGKIKFKTT